MNDTALRQGAIRQPVTTALFRGACLFIPARTLDFPAAWAFLVLTIGADLGTQLYLLRHDPELLARRSARAGRQESRPYQRFAQSAVQLIGTVVLTIAAFDHRHDWSRLPAPATEVGLALVAAGMYVMFLAVRENSFAAVVVSLQADQRVISTGPYARVRHPLYSGWFLFVLGTPLALGSWWALVPAAVALLVMIGRIIDEERFLAHSLLGYSDYLRQVRHRLIPVLW